MDFKLVLNEVLYLVFFATISNRNNWIYF